MHCQKCKSHLRLDPSLDDINPAAFKLLQDSPATSPTDGTYNKSYRIRSNIANYQQERQAKYEAAVAAQDGHAATIKQSFTQTGRKNSKNPNMSYIMLNDAEDSSPSASESPSSSSTFPNKLVPPSTPVARRKMSGKNILPMDEQIGVKEMTEANERMFDILSSRMDIDHPICNECAETLVQSMQKRMATITKEKEAGIEALRQATEWLPTEEEAAEADAAYADLLQKEEEELAKLHQIEDEKQKLEEDIRQLNEEKAKLDVLEEAHWETKNAFAIVVDNLTDEQARIDNRYEHDSKVLLRFQRANVFNDAFPIGHDGSFATINRLRLGRLPDKPVEWAEINAAWGSTCHLLSTVAKKIQFTFTGYRLKPSGSTSQIIQILSSSNSYYRKEESKVLDLFFSGDYGLGMGMFNRKFDNAMVAFLDCLKQVIVHATGRKIPTRDGKWITCRAMPYQIEKDKIGEFSIKLGAGGFVGGNSEVAWTKACKAVLICCKCLLAHASNYDEMVVNDGGIGGGVEENGRTSNGTV